MSFWYFSKVTDIIEVIVVNIILFLEVHRSMVENSTIKKCLTIYLNLDIRASQFVLDFKINHFLPSDIQNCVIIRTQKTNHLFLVLGTIISHLFNIYIRHVLN